MNPSPWVWLDGRYRRERQATLPATDPGPLFGHGVFEVTRAYGGVPFRLGDHLARMGRSAKRFRIPFRPPRLDPVVRELCRRNRVSDAYVRVTLTAGGHLLVIVRKRRPLPAAWYRNGARVMIAPWRRDPDAPLAGHKTLSYLDHVLTQREARRRGFADALLVSTRGDLMEGCASNLFLVKSGRIVTPPLGPGILPGVTRKVIMELARVRERRVLPGGLGKADEAFLTNALIEVLPIGRPGPVTRRLARAYRQRAIAETSGS